MGAEASTYSRDGCGLHTALAVRVNERRVAPAPFGAPSGCPRTGAGPPAARPPAQALDAWRRACPRPLCQKSGVYSMIIFTMSYAHWKRSSALETRIAKSADLRAPRLPLFALSYTHCRAEGMATQRGCAGGHGVRVAAPLRDAPYLGTGRHSHIAQEAHQPPTTSNRRADPPTAGSALQRSRLASRSRPT